MKQHIQILATLHIVWGALAALGSLVLLLVFGLGIQLFQTVQTQIHTTHQVPDLTPFFNIASIVWVAIGAFMLTCAFTHIIAGIGLMKHRGWARILTIVLSAINLLYFPFGTALGIYGFWVLFSAETQPLFYPNQQRTPA